MSRPFWQILLEMHDPGKAVTLNCDECFLYLEYMIDQALPGEEVDILSEAVRHHMDHCPGCREHHLLRIQELEAQRSQLSQSGTFNNRQLNESFWEK